MPSVKKEDALKYLKALAASADGFRKKAFYNAIRVIKDIREDIIEIDDLGEGIGIGKGIRQRLLEIAETGHLAEVDPYFNEIETEEMFSQVMGVGPKISKKWYQKGYRSLEDVMKNEELTNTQKLGMKYYTELGLKLPREEIDGYDLQLRQIFDCCNKVFRKFSIKADIDYQIAGSYRRGKKESGDIDCIIFNRLGTMHDKLNIKELNSPLEILLWAMRQHGILTDIIAQGPVKVMGIIVDPKIKIHRRFDFEITDMRSLPYALFYFTGSKEFNTRMRQYAKDRGWHLDQRTLLDLNEEPVWLESEAAIMNYLGEEYVKPEDRIY